MYSTSPFVQLNDKVQSMATWSSSIEGRLLTIVDAMFSDKDQREAMKSLIRNAVRDHFQETNSSISRVINEFTKEFEGSKIEYQTFEDRFSGFKYDIKRDLKEAEVGNLPVGTPIFSK